MKSVKLFIRLFFSSLFAITVLSSNSVQAADSLTLYTPYTKVSVPPGKSVNYSISLINNSKKIQDEEISVTGISRKWKYTLQAGGFNIRKLSVLPGEKKTFSLNVNVPFQVNKGNYKFLVKAGSENVLPLVINVSSKGSSESELTCDQANMQGTSKSTFTFKAKLRNRTANKQQYALMANAPRGWITTIKVNYKQATSTEVEANSTKDISIEFKAPASVKAGTYKIPIKAVTGPTSADLELEVVITGTYSLIFDTPSGLVSGHLTAGDEKRVELVLRNTGSAELKNIKLLSSKPKNWEVTFDPKEVDKLLPGKITHIYASVKADKKAIPGDYVTKFTANTPEAKSEVSFRISVRTPMLWGWIGVFIIILALGSVFYLFKKFGRR